MLAIFNCWYLTNYQQNTSTTLKNVDGQSKTSVGILFFELTACELIPAQLPTIWIDVERFYERMREGIFDKSEVPQGFLGFAGLREILDWGE